MVASTLLDNGADVTLVDDSGLTAVDVAKTKKVRNTLKQVLLYDKGGKCTLLLVNSLIEKFKFQQNLKQKIIMKLF